MGKKYVLQNLVFLHGQKAPLCTEGESFSDSERFTLAAGKRLSFSSLLNSFFERSFVDLTSLKNIHLSLNLAGPAELTLFRIRQGGRKEELRRMRVESSKRQEITLSFNLDRKNCENRVYLEVRALFAPVQIFGGCFWAELPELKRVNLGVISVTFQRECMIHTNVKALTSSLLLQDKAFHFYVVDNGNTLDKSFVRDARVSLFPNKNTGGSGGFTRGMIEANKKGGHTHLLLLDDDIELQPESVFRLIQFLGISKPVCIAGLILNRERPAQLLDAGGAYCLKENLFQLRGKFAQRLLDQEESLNVLAARLDVDYGAWPFFCFPQAKTNEVGLPLPLFISGDDVEYSVRLRKIGLKVEVVPSMAVWHDCYALKRAIRAVHTYFKARNLLILSAVHYEISYLKFVWDSYIFACRLISDGLIPHVRFFVRGIEDYLRGPNVLKSFDPKNVMGSVKTLDTYAPPQVTPARIAPKVKRGRLLIWIATKLRGSFWIRTIWNAFAFRHELFPRLKALAIVLYNARKSWPDSCRVWQESAPLLQSEAYWTEELGLQENALIRPSLERPNEASF